MKVKHNIIILLFLIIFISLIGCDISEPEKATNPLLGKWSESFEYNGFPGYIITEYNNDYDPIIQTSTIEFTDNDFTVKILPQIVHLTGVSDTLYSGTYSAFQDTIIFNLNKGDSTSIEKMNYFIENDSLYFSIPLILMNQRVYILQVSVHLYGVAV